MKVILAGDGDTNELFAVCFNPHCVFKMKQPVKGDTDWGFEFVFGVQPSYAERERLEAMILEAVSGD